MKRVIRDLFLVGSLVAIALSPIAMPYQSWGASSPGTSSLASSASASSSSSSALGDFKVEGMRVAEMDSNHLRIAVDLSTVPSRTVTLEDLHLTSLRLNGLPAFAEPLDQPISLVAGKSIALPPMYINAQMRDFTSVAPLREMVEKQSVHVEGQIIASIKMSFFEKLGLRTQHPRVYLTINQQVPVVIGSNRLERQAALGALRLIDFAMQRGTTAKRELPGAESQWIRDLRTEGDANLMLVETSYQLKEHGGSYPMVSDQLGFRIHSGMTVTTVEATVPWEYDADVQGRIKTSKMKLDKKQTEIELRPAATDRVKTDPVKTGSGKTDSYKTDSDKTGAESDQLRLGHHDFSIEHRPYRAHEKAKDPLIVEKGQSDDYTRVLVSRRDSPDNLAVLKLEKPQSTEGFAVAPNAILQQDHWKQVAVYRLIPGAAFGAGAGETKIDVVQLPARREGQRIVFDHPLDETFYGSPIVAPEGVLGVVQDERAGSLLPADLAAGEGLAQR